MATNEDINGFSSLLTKQNKKSRNTITADLSFDVLNTALVLTTDVKPWNNWNAINTFQIMKAMRQMSLTNMISETNAGKK